MRCVYISVAAAALCLDGVLALGSLHRGYQRNYRNTGRAVLAAQNEHHKVNRTGVSGKDHGHAYLARSLEMRQTSGRCGPQDGRCPGDLCCSDYGFCGESVDHCAPLFDCQPQYGVCGWPRVPAVTTTSTTSTTSTSSTSTTPTTTSTTSSSTSTTSSTTSTTPTSTSTTSSTSTTPTPTSTSTSTSVAVPPTSSTSSGATSTPTGTLPGGLQITTNGQCGNGTSCIGNPNYGPCCSQFFWCGSALDFCGSGCQSQFGACLGVPGQPPVSASNVTTIPGPTSTSTSTSTTSTSTTSTTSTSVPPVITTTSTTSTTSTSTTSTSTTSSAPPTSTVVIPPGFKSSTDGSCGPGVTCLGSTYGRCCSQFGWCGDSDQFCPYIVGCQPEYGYCDPKP